MKLVKTIDWLYFFAVEKSMSNTPARKFARAGPCRAGAPSCAASPAPGLRRDGFALARPGLCAAVLSLVVCLSFVQAARASDKLEGEIIVEQAGQRHGDLRRTLLHVSNMSRDERQRRRLSAEERKTLRRELRETISGGLYERQQEPQEDAGAPR